MRLVASQLRLTPSDLSGYLGCRHRTGLDLAVAMGRLPRPAWHDPVAQALRERGEAHERAYVDHLRQQGLHVVEIDQALDPDARVAQTLATMRGGAQAIVQTALAIPGGGDRQHAWLGYADVLQRVPAPSSFGSWASRTWQMIQRHGIIQAVQRVVSRSAESAGYKALIGMGLQDKAFEAVVLRHRSMFDPVTVARAEVCMRDWTADAVGE